MSEIKCTYADYFYHALFGYPLPREQNRGPMAPDMRLNIAKAQQNAWMQYQEHVARMATDAQVNVK